MARIFRWQRLNRIAQLDQRSALGGHGDPKEEVRL